METLKTPLPAEQPPQNAPKSILSKPKPKADLGTNTDLYDAGTAVEHRGIRQPRKKVVFNPRAEEFVEKKDKDTGTYTVTSQQVTVNLEPNAAQERAKKDMEGAYKKRDYTGKQTGILEKAGIESLRKADGVKSLASDMVPGDIDVFDPDNSGGSFFAASADDNLLLAMAARNDAHNQGTEGELPEKFKHLSEFAKQYDEATFTKKEDLFEKLLENLDAVDKTLYDQFSVLGVDALLMEFLKAQK